MDKRAKREEDEGSGHERRKMGSRRRAQRCVEKRGKPGRKTEKSKRGKMRLVRRKMRREQDKRSRGINRKGLEEGEGLGWRGEW